MTFPSAIDPNHPAPEAMGSVPPGPPQGDLDRLVAAPPSASPAVAAAPHAGAHAGTDPRIPVALVGAARMDDAIRIDASAAEAASAATTGRPARLGWRAAALGLAACLGAAAGSAGLAAIAPFVSTPRIAQAESFDELRGLKDAVATLRGQIKTVGDNVAALRASFNSATAAVSSQLAKISDEVEKVERERRAATAAPDSSAPTVSETKPAKPPVVEGWVLRSVSDGVALVEGRHGMIEIEPGDSLPGVGRIHEIKRQDGHWVVVTPKGLIVSAR